MTDDPIRQQIKFLRDAAKSDMLSVVLLKGMMWTVADQLEAALSSPPAPQPAETKEQEQELGASAPARSPASSADAGTETLPNG